MWERRRRVIILCTVALVIVVYTRLGRPRTDWTDGSDGVVVDRLKNNILHAISGNNIVRFWCGLSPRTIIYAQSRIRPARDSSNRFYEPFFSPKTFRRGLLNYKNKTVFRRKSVIARHSFRAYGIIISRPVNAETVVPGHTVCAYVSFVRILLCKISEFPGAVQTLEAIATWINP